MDTPPRAGPARQRPAPAGAHQGADSMVRALRGHRSALLAVVIGSPVCVGTTQCSSRLTGPGCAVSRLARSGRAGAAAARVRPPRRPWLHAARWRAATAPRPQRAPGVRRAGPLAVCHCRRPRGRQARAASLAAPPGTGPARTGWTQTTAWQQTGEGARGRGRRVACSNYTAPRQVAALLLPGLALQHITPPQASAPSPPASRLPPFGPSTHLSRGSCAQQASASLRRSAQPEGSPCGHSGRRPWRATSWGSSGMGTPAKAR